MKDQAKMNEYDKYCIGNEITSGHFQGVTIFGKLWEIDVHRIEAYVTYIQSLFISQILVLITFRMFLYTFCVTASFINITQLN